MTTQIWLDRTGDPAVLLVRTIDRQAPGPGQVWLEQEAIGVNYIDVTQRRGMVPIPLPSGLGLAGAGVVSAVGAGVTDIAVGDRVCYALGPLGGYASGRLYPAERLVKLPETIAAVAAASIVFKGITAQYLIKSTYAVAPGTVVLLYGAAGALGQVIAPWAKHLGAFVIGVVSKEASIERARAAGCAEVLIWNEANLPKEVARLTGGRKADVVYDGVGRTTFAASLDCLRQRGTMVSIGASTGAPAPVEVGTLNSKGSLFLTRPGLAAYATDANEYRGRIQDVFKAVESGIIKPSIWKTFPLSEAAAAHTALEGGKSAGAIVLKP